ncbi:MAG: endolytic transglycosylase MltG [Oscillospiraceae bacterium]|nr:endolytic transglycosylase MltG [Oscillospiraceae bacterium]
MDNNRNSKLSAEDQQWLDALLGRTPSEQTSQSHEEPVPQKELGPDEEAISNVGLTHPNDMKLEQILAEHKLTDAQEEAPLSQKAAVLPATSTKPERRAIRKLPQIRFRTAEPKPAVSSPEETVEPEDTVLTEEDVLLDEAVLPEEMEQPLPKGRPKRKKGYGLFGLSHILATVIWIALIVAIGVSLGRVIWVCCADIMAFGKPSQEVTITITEQDDIESIANKLNKANLVRYPGLFQLFAEATGKDERISVGTFTLNSHLDYNALINNMVEYGPAREEVDVMFPEGATCAQIFALLEENGVCSIEKLEAYAIEGELGDYWFLEGLPRDSKYCLEGYLAPDTYTFYTNDEPGRVLAKFLNEFDSRFSEKMREDFGVMQERYANMLSSFGYDQSYIEAHPLTLHQAVTVASIVAKETSSDFECYKIASVFYNRLTNPNFLKLDSDATVYYAIGDYFGEVDELTAEHLNVDSPYNTRKYKGLPPGPICNPGAYAMYSALKPDNTNYYYFLYDYNNYSHIFSSTYDEHMQHVNNME